MRTRPISRMHPDRLTKQVAFLDANPATDVVCSAAFIMDVGGRAIGIRGKAKRDLSPRGLLRTNTIIHPSVMGRAQWFMDNPYDGCYPRAEDHEIWCRTLGTSTIAHLSEPLLFYRAATGASRKYRQSCASDRKIYRRYGPRLIGSFGTAMLISRGFLKPLAYSLQALIGNEDLLVNARSAALTPEERAAYDDALDLIGKCSLPERKVC
jgi:hypothetical protein